MSAQVTPQIRDSRPLNYAERRQEGKVAPVAGSSQVLDLADSFFDIFDAITPTWTYDDNGQGPGDRRERELAAMLSFAEHSPR
ncbi:hypothetical protein [Streptomyces incanus]|uniref:Uncharacterized protein n=1 Tax=Streptomyces incanus TaxID=887453 RepID=A0ABW0XSD5_9ACTN